MLKMNHFLTTGAILLPILSLTTTPCLAAQGGMDGAMNRIMSRAKSKDGKLRKSEILDGDSFLKDHFAEADANHDGGLTMDELRSFFMKQAASHAPGGGGGGRGQGGGGGFGPMPKPGTIMPDRFADMLKLTPDQKKQFALVQKEVDGSIAKILTPAQTKQLAAVGTQPAGGPGGGRGPGGGGAPGGMGGMRPSGGGGQAGMGGMRPPAGGAPGGGAGMRGPGGGAPGGMGAPGGVPRKRTILPGFIMDQLKVTPAQTAQLEALQTSVDAKRDKILTEAQKKQIAEMRSRFGGGGGMRGGGPGGQGGPPPAPAKK